MATSGELPSAKRPPITVLGWDAAATSPVAPSASTANPPRYIAALVSWAVKKNAAIRMIERTPIRSSSRALALTRPRARAFGRQKSASVAPSSSAVSRENVL